MFITRRRRQAGTGTLQAPVLANESAYFGQLTATGAGDYYMTNTGGAVQAGGWSITAGGGGVWQIDSNTGKITPSGALGAGPYALTVQATNSAGSSSKTLTITTSGTDTYGYDLAKTYSVASSAQLSAAITAIGTPASMTAVRNIMFRAGIDYDGTQINITNKRFAYTVSFTRHANEAAPWIRRSGNSNTVFIQESDNVTIQRLKISNYNYSGVGFGIVYAQGGTQVSNINILDNEIFYETVLTQANYRTMNVPQGVYWHGSMNGINLSVDRNYIHDVDYGIRQMACSGTCSADGNLIINYIQDGIQCNQRTGMTSTSLDDNVIIGAIGEAVYGYHSDPIQLASAGMTEDWSNGTCNRNIIIDSYQWADMSGLFLAGAGGSYYMSNWEVRGNILVVDGVTTGGLRVPAVKNCTVSNNTVVTPRGNFSPSTGKCTVIVGETSTSGVNTVTNNVGCDQIKLAGVDVTASGNNYNLGNMPSEALYATLFVGGANWDVTTRAEAIAKFAALVSGDLYTASPPIGAAGVGLVNWPTTSPGSDGSFVTPWPPVTSTPMAYANDAFEDSYGGASYG